MYSVTEQFVTWLRGLGYDAYTRPPRESAGAFVTVERTGGGTSDLIDKPLMAIQTWAATEAEAEQAATEIRNEILTSTRPHGVGAISVNAGPYAFFDEYTRMPRYQLVLNVSCQLVD